LRVEGLGSAPRGATCRGTPPAPVGAPWVFGVWCVVFGVLSFVCGVWCVVCGVCGVWCVEWGGVFGVCCLLFGVVYRCLVVGGWLFGV